MNISDKDRLFHEVRRVLKPGGTFGIYDQMREADGDLVYPLPWASAPETSFVEPPAMYKRLLTEAGFEVVWERNCRDDALAFFNRQAAMRPGASAPPALPHNLTMGSGAIEKSANFRINIERGLIAPNEIVAGVPTA